MTFPIAGSPLGSPTLTARGHVAAARARNSVQRKVDRWYIFTRTGPTVFTAFPEAAL